MKALIRHEGETVLETAQIDGIEWTTGAPLTNLSWAGGPYALCEDCPVQDPEPQDFDISEVQVPDASAPAGDEGETPTVLRRIATFNRTKYDARKAEDSADDTEPAPAPEMPAEGTEGAQADESAPDTIIIDGVTYTRSVTE